MSERSHSMNMCNCKNVQNYIQPRWKNSEELGCWRRHCEKMMLSSWLPGHPDLVFFTALKISLAFNEILAFYAFWPQSWPGGQMDAPADVCAEPQTTVARWVVFTIACWYHVLCCQVPLGLLWVFGHGLLSWRWWMKRIFSPQVFRDVLMQNASPMFMLQTGEQIVGICLLPCKQNQATQGQPFTWAWAP